MSRTNVFKTLKVELSEDEFKVRASFSRPIEPICAPRQDRKRLRGQNLVVLERLRKGSATTRDLILMGIAKYTSRISDLRAAGYDVKATRIENGIWKYELMG